MKSWILVLVSLFFITAFSSVMASNSSDIAVSLTIPTYLSYNMSYTSIPYGTQTAGSSDIVAPDQSSGKYNISVSTNGNFDVKVNGTNFQSDSQSFGIDNLKMDTDPTLGSLAVGNAVALSTAPTTIDSNITYTTTLLYNGFWLSIPSSQAGGSYNANITIVLQNI